jgi:THO complex subunit 3
MYVYKVNELAWSANSDYLLLAYGGKISDAGGIDIMKFNSDIFELIDSYVSNTAPLYSLKIDPSYSRIAVSAGDSIVSLWDLEEMICYKTLQILE